MALNHPRFSTNGTGKHPKPATSSLEERSRSAAEALAPRYAELNRLWAEAEARLKAMQVPRYAWVTFRSEAIDPQDYYSPRDCECLGLVKVRGEWRLCLGLYTQDEYHAQQPEPDGPTEWKPIADCSVEERVAAAPHISALRAKIVESAEHYVGKVDEAIAHLTKSLEQF